jgi:hypothetical protein
MWQQHNVCKVSWKYIKNIYIQNYKLLKTCPCQISYIDIIFKFNIQRFDVLSSLPFMNVQFLHA